MFHSLCKAIESHNHFIIVSHMRPDGDAIGSTLALGLMLQGLGKKVQMWNADGVPQRFSFLHGADQVQPVPSALPEGVDAFVCVDSGNLNRIDDQAVKLFHEAPFTINIDHHATNSRYADLNVVDGDAAACGLVLYHFFRHIGTELTLPIAEALYVSISTDTGSFQYSSTTPAIMRIAADLLEKGIDAGRISRRVYHEMPLSAFTVKRDVLNRMVVDHDAAIVHYSLSAARKEELGLKLEDTKDLVDIIRVLQGTKTAAVFEEVGGGLIRVSLRSKDPQIDVSQIALQFGGGGHSLAAGIRMRGGLEECRGKVLDAIRAATHRLP